MQSTWLHRHQHKECIVFVSGWGMDPTPFQDIPAPDCDLCMFFDYRQPQPFALQPFADYERLHLLTWSLGVWVAAHFLADQADTFASRTAIGGTLFPVDGKRGIPPEKYDELVHGFDAEAQESFFRAMFDDPDQCRRFLAHRPQRQAPELLDELTAIRGLYSQQGPAADIYTQAIVTSRDRIFSGRNQMRAWGRSALVHNWPHFPFYQLTDWRQLLG